MGVRKFANCAPDGAFYAPEVDEDHHRAAAMQEDTRFSQQQILSTEFKRQRVCGMIEAKVFLHDCALEGNKRGVVLKSKRWLVKAVKLLEKEIAKRGKS